LYASKTKVKVLPQALEDMKVLFEKFPHIEWNAYMLGTRVEEGMDTIIVLESLQYHIHQKQSGASVAQTVDAEHPKEKFLGLLHSHHSMGVFFSGDDDTTALNFELFGVVGYNGMRFQETIPMPCDNTKFVMKESEIEGLEEIRRFLQQLQYTAEFIVPTYVQPFQERSLYNTQEEKSEERAMRSRFDSEYEVWNRLITENRERSAPAQDQGLGGADDDALALAVKLTVHTRRAATLISWWLRGIRKSLKKHNDPFETSTAKAYMRVLTMEWDFRGVGLAEDFLFWDDRSGEELLTAVRNWGADVEELLSDWMNWSEELHAHYQDEFKGPEETEQYVDSRNALWAFLSIVEDQGIPPEVDYILTTLNMQPKELRQQNGIIKRDIEESFRKF
jgi:hypothetical protein